MAFDPLGLQAALKALPAETQSALMPLLSAIFDRMDALESQTAKDTQAIADKVIAALVPQLQAVTQTANDIGGQALDLIRAVEDRGFKVTLGDPKA